MKDVLINWNKQIFDGEKRLLPHTDKLITYTSLSDGSTWSVVLRFDESPRLQGYVSKAKAEFLVENAPADILKNGFRFDIFDGPKQIAVCEVLEKQVVNIKHVMDKIDEIEGLKKHLQVTVNSIAGDNFIDFTEDELINLAKHCIDYPYLFALILKLNKKIAFDFLLKYYLRTNLNDLVVYQSSLPFFFYTISKQIGSGELKLFYENLPLEVKSDSRVKGAYDDAL